MDNYKIDMKKYQKYFDKFLNLEKEKNNLSLEEYLYKKNMLFIGSHYDFNNLPYTDDLYFEDMFFIDFIINKNFKNLIRYYYNDFVSCCFLRIYKFRNLFDITKENSSYFSFMCSICYSAICEFLRKENKYNFKFNMVSLSSEISINSDKTKILEEIIPEVDNFEENLNYSFLKEKCLKVIKNLKLYKNSKFKRFAVFYILNNFTISFKEFKEEFGNCSRQNFNNKIQKLKKILSKNFKKENLI